MCRGSEKYFVLMLYRLFSADEEFKKRIGNVNLIIVDGYIMKGGYCWGFLFFNLSGWGVLNLSFCCITH